jgi:hypothetical protein
MKMRILKADKTPENRSGDAMYETSFGERTTAGLHRRRPGKRPSRRGGLAGFLGVLTVAVTVLLAAPAAAQAATTSGPSASLSLAAASISAGTRPLVTFITTDVPAGSVIYLQRAIGSSGKWQNVGRLTAYSGTVRAPADPAGSFRYRILIADGGSTQATSTASDLSVTGAPGQTGTSGTSGQTGASGDAGCTSCAFTAVAVPLLAPIVEPVIQSVVLQIGSVVLAILGALFGL